VLTIAVVAAGTVAGLANYALRLEVDVLDSSSDGGAFGLVGDLALASAAIAAWAVLGRVRPRAQATAVLAVLLSFLALDKAFRLHDEIAHWPDYYLPILGATLTALLLVARRLPAESRPLIVFGLALLGISLLIHFTGDTVLEKLRASDEGWAHQLKAAIKHGAEVAGWLMVTLSLVLGAVAAADHGRQARARPGGRPLGRGPTARRQPSESS
jgi:hypothetical protein